MSQGNEQKGFKQWLEKVALGNWNLGRSRQKNIRCVLLQKQQVCGKQRPVYSGEVTAGKPHPITKILNRAVGTCQLGEMQTHGLSQFQFWDFWSIGKHLISSQRQPGKEAS